MHIVINQSNNVFGMDAENKIFARPPKQSLLTRPLVTLKPRCKGFIARC